MKRLLVAALSFAIAFPAVAQQTQVTQQTVTTTQNGVTRTETRTVVTSYQTYLHGVYAGIGLPENLIAQLIRLDMLILEARIRLDFVRVRALIEEQIRLLTPVQVTEIRTYITRHPVPVEIPVYAQPVWINNVSVVDNIVRANISDETVIRTAVQRENIKVEDLKIDANAKAPGSLESSAQTNRTGIEAQSQIKTDADVKIDPAKPNDPTQNRNAPDVIRDSEPLPDASRQQIPAASPTGQQQGRMPSPDRPSSLPAQPDSKSSIEKTAPGQANPNASQAEKDKDAVRSEKEKEPKY